MKLVAHTSRELAERYKKMYPAYVVIKPDQAGEYYVYLKRRLR